MIQILLSLLIIFLCTYSRSAEDAPQDLKSLIKSYEQAQPDSTDSFVFANLLGIRRAFSKDKVLKTTSLSVHELKALDRAERETKNLATLATELESKLTPDDVAIITKDNPESVYRVLGKFRITSGQAECTPTKYAELKKQVDLAELFSRGQHVGAYVDAAELPFSKSYLNRLSKLVTDDQRFQNYRRLTDTVLSEKAMSRIREESGLSSFANTISGPNPDRMKQYGGYLIKEGVPQGELKSYVLKHVLISPECLGTISMLFIKSIRRDFAIAKIKKFSQRLTGASLLKENFTYGLEKFVDAKDPYLRSAKDPWGGFIEISKIGHDKVKLVSLGDDRKSPTDDIESEPITVLFR